MNVVQKINTATSAAERFYAGMARPPVFGSSREEREHRKQRLAAAFRLFSKFGFDEGVAGHITARDPEFTDTFWVNPFGMHFSLIKVSDLIRVDHTGRVVEGAGPVNAAAFAIHSRVHAARPDSVAAAHAHSTYGRAFSSLGRKLELISQDVCAFYNDHALYDDYGGVAVELDSLGSEQGGHSPEPRSPHRWPNCRRSRMVVHHHGAFVPGSANGRSRRRENEPSAKIDLRGISQASEPNRRHAVWWLVSVSAALRSHCEGAARLAGLSAVWAGVRAATLGPASSGPGARTDNHSTPLGSAVKTGRALKMKSLTVSLEGTGIRRASASLYPKRQSTEGIPWSVVRRFMHWLLFQTWITRSFAVDS